MPPTHTPTPGGCPATGNNGYEDQLIGLINAERANRGLGQLGSQSQLTSAARSHSTDMACNDFVSHTGSDGSSPFDRMLAHGYGFSAAAENIYAGNGPFNSPQAAFDSWMSSAGHRDNMLNPAFVDVGIGYRFNANSQYGGYFTAKFGTP